MGKRGDVVATANPALCRSAYVRLLGGIGGRRTVRQTTNSGSAGTANWRGKAAVCR